MASLNRINFEAFRIICVVATIVFITAAGTKPTQARDDPGELLNYAFAVWVGSGVYILQS